MFRPTKSYWRSYGALYGEQVSHSEQAELDIARPAKKKKKPKPKIILPTEQQEQFVAVAWLRKNNILFYHVPNGGRRDYLEAAKFKRLGVSAGVPDICIPISRKESHGLYIELKRLSGGVLSDAQRYWMEKLRNNGYECYEAKGAADLILYVKRYLGMV